MASKTKYPKSVLDYVDALPGGKLPLWCKRGIRSKAELKYLLCCIEGWAQAHGFGCRFEDRTVFLKPAELPEFALDFTELADLAVQYPAAEWDAFAEQCLDEALAKRP